MVRTEEMLISVLDEHSARGLDNTTPTRAGNRSIGSVVMTVQDLAPLDEMERQRAEFLGLVGHELREPLAAMRGSATTLLRDAATLDPAEMCEFDRIIIEQVHQMRSLIGNLLNAGRVGSGAEHLHAWRWSARHPRRPAGRPAAGYGRPAAREDALIAASVAD